MKEQRRQRPVPIEPGRVIADYVPSYFAPRSPTMFAIHKGNVPEYRGGIDPLIYLVTTIERLMELGIDCVFTDGNAATGFTRFSGALADLDDLIDWPLMHERMWRDTPEDGDRRRRRMAECLASGPVPWAAFVEVAARSDERPREATDALATIGVIADVSIQREWYF